MKILTVGERIISTLADGYVEHDDYFDSAGNIIAKTHGLTYTVVDIPTEQPWDFSTAAYVVRDGKLVYSEEFKISSYRRYENRVRDQRDSELNQSDWTQLPDAFNGDAVLKAECAAYRQLLRDITSQPGYPFEVEWPERPEPLKLFKIAQRLGGLL